VFCKLTTKKGIKMKFEVMYKVLTNNINESGAWTSSGPSNYTVVVEAPYQSAAEQMVKNMNGGSNHCHIIRAMHIG
jgi:hypothetical protein